MAVGKGVSVGRGVAVGWGVAVGAAVLGGTGVGRGVGDGTEVAVGAAATLTTGLAGSDSESDWSITAKIATPTAITAIPKETTATLVERGESSIFLAMSDKAIRTCLSFPSSFRGARDRWRTSRLRRTPVNRIELYKRDGTGKSWQSLPHHGNHASKPPPFAFTPCHSEPPSVIPSAARNLSPLRTA